MYSPDYGLVIKVQKRMGGDNVHETAGLLQLVMNYHFLWKRLGKTPANQTKRAEISSKLEEAEKKLRIHFWSKINRAQEPKRSVYA